ncbi:hypothetical protein JVU11DRAFT_10290 [Chiua virens]|nr:hypothetical protein JVU11DRAFT_10290 [Chiua virens]
MAGFLRKKTTLSKKSSLSPPPRTDDPPPTLPPLLLSSSLDPDPRPAPTLPPAASPPVLPSADVHTLGDVWDPWTALVDGPRLDTPSGPFITHFHLHPASNASRDVSNTRNTSVSHPNPVATAPKTSTRQVHALPPKTDPLGNRPLSPKPSPPRRPSSPPAVVRGQAMPPSTFDFEESLSAANVTSVVNQFRSYPPPIRHHTSPAPPSQMAFQHPSSSAPHRHHTLPQKPGSSSSLSSSSHNTDATRRTNGSYSTSTSASSISPVNEASPSSFSRSI